MRFLRSTIAVWLLVTFGACYAFPVINTMSARTTKCCHRGGHGSCCRKSENTTGSFWTAAADCAQGCRLAAGITVHASPLVTPDSAASQTAARSDLLTPNADTAGSSAYFAFLYQRPPPSRF